MLQNSTCQPSSAAALLLSTDLCWARHTVQVENVVKNLAQPGLLFILLFLTNPAVFQGTIAACVVWACDS